VSSNRAYGLPESINELAGTTNVSTLTVLKAFTNLGSYYHTLLFVVQNTDNTNTVTVTIETSEDGVYADQHVLWSLSCPAQKQASLEVGPGLLRRYWRISANSQGPGYPTVALKWAVRGVHRTT
jgi:hypothetical protein